MVLSVDSLSTIMNLDFNFSFFTNISHTRPEMHRTRERAKHQMYIGARHSRKCLAPGLKSYINY